MKVCLFVNFDEKIEFDFERFDLTKIHFLRKFVYIFLFSLTSFHFTYIFKILVSGKKPSTGSKPQRYRAQQNLDVQSTSPEENVPSYMRSTSSSAKKERPASAASSAAFPQARRRSSFGQTQSTLDLRTAALDDDSSSEENMQRSINKGRRRSSSHDRR